MRDFYSVISEWSAFYETLAGVAATFAGLLFVSLSLHLDLLHHVAFARARHLARHTFSSFLFLVVFALIFLIPNHTPVGLSIPLLVIGSLALTQTLLNARRLISRARDTEARLPRIRRIYLLSALTYTVLIAVAMLLLRGYTGAMDIVVGLLIWHLAWTTRSAWDLLLELHAEAPQKEASGEAPNA